MLEDDTPEALQKWSEEMDDYSMLTGEDWARLKVAFYDAIKHEREWWANATASAMCDRRRADVHP